MLNGCRFRLYPTKEQQQILLRWIEQMPKAGFFPHGAKAKAGLNRVRLSSAWSCRLPAIKPSVLALDNRPSQAELVCQRCGHTNNADHNAAVVIAQRGIQKLLCGNPLTKAHKATRIFR